MMKYETPDFEVVLVEGADVVCASGEPPVGPTDPTNPGDNGGSI